MRVGADHLYFYDAISPIVLAETIDMNVVFRASRWNRNIRQSAVGSQQSAAEVGKTCGIDDGEGDYLNCPMNADQYRAFYAALTTAESATVHDFDKEKFFEGCLPIEVMAHRGEDTLRFGPMKPVGLTDPRTGRQPYAAVQLRQDNLAGDHYSLVGFQTQLKWGEQARVLRMIPGLEQAEFVRFGMVHRNTYINGPTVLRETWQTKRMSPCFCRADFRRRRLCGVAASGLIAGRNAAALVQGEALRVPPRTTRSVRSRSTVPTPIPRLSTHEHHLWHHGAPTRAHSRQAETEAGHCQPCAGRAGALERDVGGAGL